MRTRHNIARLSHIVMWAMADILEYLASSDSNHQIFENLSHDPHNAMAKVSNVMELDNRLTNHSKEGA